MIDAEGAAISHRFQPSTTEAGSSTSGGLGEDLVIISSSSRNNERAIFVDPVEETEQPVKMELPSGTLLFDEIEREAPRSPRAPLVCENMDSTMNATRLNKLLSEIGDPWCRLVVPQDGERCHRFDNFEPDQVIRGLFFQLLSLRLECPYQCIPSSGRC